MWLTLGLHCFGAIISTGVHGGPPMAYTWGGTKEYEEVIKNTNQNLDRLCRRMASAFV